MPLRVAKRARPHGTALRSRTARALGRLGSLSVHPREHEARLGMAEDLKTIDYFAGDVAARYDESSADMPVEPVVDFLSPLAGGGALEFAIGTGRIAVPLAERGVRVEGIDFSPDMVAQLRQKTTEIPVAIGDMTTTRVESTFSLVYIVFNSIFNLRTQEQQVACFENAAAHLEPGGAFVVELLVPELQRLPQGDRFLLFDASPDHVGFDEFDLVTQELTSHHYDPERSTYTI